MCNLKILSAATEKDILYLIPLCEVKAQYLQAIRRDWAFTSHKGMKVIVDHSLKSLETC